MLAMLLDHVGGDSWLTPLTGGNRFFVSAAEAFVIISGALVGIVYGKVMLRKGPLAVVKKALHRAARLYLLTIVVSITFALTGKHFGMFWQPEAGLQSFVLQTFTLRYTVFLVDIMLLYTLLLLLAIPILLLLSKGLYLTVLTISWLVWAAWQLLPPGTLSPAIEGNAVFNLAVWQVLFTTAVVLGYHRQHLEAWFDRLPKAVTAVLLITLTALAIALYAVWSLDLGALPATLVASASDKANLPAQRLLAVGLYCSVAFAWVTLAWQPICLLTGRLLLPLGTNALTAYWMHLVAVTASSVLVPMLLGGKPFGRAENTFLDIMTLLLIWSAVTLWSLLRGVAKARTQPASFIGLRSQPEKTAA